MADQPNAATTPRRKVKGLDRKSSAWQQNWLRWRLADDLCGGTRAMRFAGQLWLPKYEKESKKAYAFRLCNSFLFPAFQDTVEKMSGKPFVEPVELVTTQGEGQDSKNIDAELPGDLAKLPDNIDRQGKELTSWAREEFRDRVKYSAAIFLVLYPNVKRALEIDRKGRDNAPSPGSPANEEEKKRLAFQPYFARVLPENVLGAQFEDRGDGLRSLALVRIRETYHETGPDYEERVVEEVRIFRRGYFELWRRVESERGGTTAALQRKNKAIDMAPDANGSGQDFEFIDGGPMLDVNGKQLDCIPIVTDPPDYLQKEFGQDSLPLEQLMWLNVKHWQSQSAQDNSLFIARVPFLVTTGVNSEDKERTLEVGPTTHWIFTSKDAKTGYIEPTGKALEAGQNDLDKCEDMMALSGAQPFVKRKQAPKTATEREIDESGNVSQAQEMVRSFADALLRGFKLAAQWVAEELPEGIKVKIFDEFDSSDDNQPVLDWLLKARTAREIPQKQFLLEAQLRKGISEEADIDEMVTALEEEKPALSDLVPRGTMPGAPGAPGQPGNAPGAPPAQAKKPPAPQPQPTR